MGQYYHAVLSDGAKKILVYETGGEGAKLTEHSYFGGDLVTTAVREIYKNPRRVMWCGDYAEEADFKEIHERTKASMPALNSIWGNDEETMSPIPGGFRDNDKFLVNHDKNEYIDLGEVFALALEDDTTLHPLPILTAVGNGRGGGDYISGDDAQKAMVGTWAWDRISVEDNAPKGFKKISAVFTDNVPCPLGGHLHPDCIL